MTPPNSRPKIVNAGLAGCFTASPACLVLVHAPMSGVHCSRSRRNLSHPNCLQYLQDPELFPYKFSTLILVILMLIVSMTLSQAWCPY